MIQVDDGGVSNTTRYGNFRSEKRVSRDVGVGLAEYSEDCCNPLSLTTPMKLG